MRLHSKGASTLSLIAPLAAGFALTASAALAAPGDTWNDSDFERVQLATEIEVRVNEAPGFLSLLDFRRFLVAHPDARALIPSALLKNPPASIPSARWRALNIDTQRNLYDPTNARPEDLIALGRAFLPRIHEILLRSDLPVPLTNAYAPFEWLRDPLGVLEFRHRGPLSSPWRWLDEATALIDSLSLKPGQGFSIHTHFSKQGRSLRPETALMNLSLGIYEPPDPQNFNQFQSVESKGFVRWLGPGHLEVRVRNKGPRAQLQFLLPAVRDPRKFAEELATKPHRISALFQRIPTLRDQQSAYRWLAESVAAVERFCPGCLAKERALTEALGRAMTRNDSAAQEAALLLGEMSGLPDALAGAVRKALKGRLSATNGEPFDIHRLFATQDPEIRAEVLSMLQNMPEERRYLALGEVTELDHPDFQDYAHEELSRLPLDAGPKAYPIFQLSKGLPEDKAVREGLLRLLRQGNPGTRAAAAEALAKAALILSNEEAHEVLTTARGLWGNPSQETANMRDAILRSGDKRWLPDLVADYLDQGSPLVLSDVLVASGGPQGEAVQSQLARGLTYGGAARTRALEVLSRMEYLNPTTELVLAKSILYLSKDDITLAREAALRATNAESLATVINYRCTFLSLIDAAQK